MFHPLCNSNTSNKSLNGILIQTSGLWTVIAVPRHTLHTTTARQTHVVSTRTHRPKCIIGSLKHWKLLPGDTLSWTHWAVFESTSFIWNNESRDIIASYHSADLWITVVSNEWVSNTRRIMKRAVLKRLEKKRKKLNLVALFKVLCHHHYLTWKEQCVLWH